MRLSRLTPRAEKFCQLVVLGNSQSDAYRSSHSVANMKPSTINNNAYKLMLRADVQARIEELRAPVVERMGYDLERAMQESERAIDIALQKENAGALVAAITLRAKLNGLLVERKVVLTNPLEGMTGQELLALKERLRGLAGQADSGTLTE